MDSLPLPPNEQDWLEKYVFNDSDEAYNSLVPGSHEQVFFRLLRLQAKNPEETPEEKEILDKLAETNRVEANTFRFRRNLLSFHSLSLEDKTKFAEEIRRKFGTFWGHSRREVSVTPSTSAVGPATPDHADIFPTSFDNAQILPETLVRKAANAYAFNTILPDGWAILLQSLGKLPKDLLAPLMCALDDEPALTLGLGRHPWLVSLIKKYYGTDKYTQTLGQIYKILTEDEMDSLSGVFKEHGEAAVIAQHMLTLIDCNADVDCETDPEAKAAFYGRLYKLAQGLPPSMWASRLTMLLALIKYDLSIGVLDEDHMEALLKVPHSHELADSRYYSKAREVYAPASLDCAELRCATARADLRSPPDENKLLLAWFYEYFGQPNHNSQKAFSPYLATGSLHGVLCHAKLMAGQEPAKWAAAAGPAQVARWREEVVLEWCPTNRAVYGPDETVTVELYVKNVSQLTVAVYEVNTTGYYQGRLEQIQTDVNLEGLVPNLNGPHTP
ncbi:hypothetical protein PAPYR_6449 [Paratrimastix pyriformis]|uniref:Uncharacterized protein n=1 Tax=Paratrimastix pyriformis TaxID=342808 RepID=A0ABQ8UHQ2_9EUKA|nr:hypothetical protein PAPYR_6449 [Paratrimastix pyriformis]